MASRRFTQFQSTLEKGVVDIWATITVGAAGAVTLAQWNPGNRTYTAAPTSGTGNYAVGSRGIKSVVRNSAGNWTVTLQDSYQRLLSVKAWFQSSTGIPAAPVLGIITSGSNVNSNTSPTVQVVLSTGGVATDPGNGETVTLRFTLQNSGAL